MSRVVVLAVWAAGVGHRAVAVCRPGPVGAPAGGRWTVLSRALWDTYVRPADPGDDERAVLRQGRGEGLAGVLTAISDPHLPDGHGLLVVSCDPVLEYAHSVGRVLHANRR